jgi:general secretion pathway protein E
MSADELSALGITVAPEGEVTLKRGKGCRQCRGTGYYGRSAVFEMLPYSEALKRLTTAEADLEAIRTQARKEGLVTLRENAVKKLLEGETTYQEVLRVTWEQV